MKKFIIISIIGLTACTSGWEEFNTNPYGVTDKMLEQDFNNVGAFYPSMLYNLFAWQVEHNLVNDTYIRHLGTPTPFVSGRNNTTYYITWNSFWSNQYTNIMAPSRQVIQIAEEGGYPEFASWAKLIQITSMTRLSAYHGPLIYSNYGSPEDVILYDSEETLYNTWFSELDEIMKVFSANPDYPGLVNFDATYSGDMRKWMRYINSLRLQLAIRISKVSPQLAKTQGEKAISDPAGLILTNDNNMYTSLYGATFPPSIIDFEWDDTRMSATMESVLIGYKDGRISKYFDEATNKAACSDHPDYMYKGIRCGAWVEVKDDRLGFSHMNTALRSWTKRPLLTSSDVLFNLAEAALRGWNGAGSAKDNYENGVRNSFSEWKAEGVDEYLADNTSTPIDYIDPIDHRNDFISRMEITVKWDESASNEEKLERIMTQKWIAGYMNSIENWVDHRRTGYPKLPYNSRNDSNADWGVIAADDFLKRMPFVTAERNNNPQGVADATQKLGGPDLISTRLWWDTGGPNF